MGKVHGSKWQRGSFVRSQLRILKEGQLIYSKHVVMEKPRIPTIAERKEDIEAQTRKRKEKIQSERREKTLEELTPEERTEWERQEKLEQYHLEKAAVNLDLTIEIKEHLAARRKEIDESS